MKVAEYMAWGRVFLGIKRETDDAKAIRKLLDFQTQIMLHELQLEIDADEVGIPEEVEYELFPFKRRGEMSTREVE